MRITIAPSAPGRKPQTQPHLKMVYFRAQTAPMALTHLFYSETKSTTGRDSFGGIGAAMKRIGRLLSVAAF
jgi:hypothetical protein